MRDPQDMSSDDGEMSDLDRPGSINEFVEDEDDIDLLAQTAWRLAEEGATDEDYDEDDFGVDSFDLDEYDLAEDDDEETDDVDWDAVFPARRRLLKAFRKLPDWEDGERRPPKLSA